MRKYRHGQGIFKELAALKRSVLVAQERDLNEMETENYYEIAIHFS